MDVEGFVRRMQKEGRSPEEIVSLLAAHVDRIKGCGQEYAVAFAGAVMEEVRRSSGLQGDLFSFEHSGTGMGDFGVGSRGTGDFYVHRKIAEIIGKSGAVVGVEDMDDAGAVRAKGNYIVCTVDGMHSRLSDFPFLAGFHVTRATMRDVYVMGARPVMLFSDIHVADDGDVAKIFDYTAGVTTVGEAMGVPLVAGSTLRIGGDMVLGDRMTGCVGAVGVAEHLTPRREVVPGDMLLMTEGAGGGTIATAAIYSGNPEVVERTINLHFLRACEALLSSEVFTEVHAMTDVTNGGLRGDVHELSQTCRCRIVVEEAPLRHLIDPAVLSLLDRLRIDHLGVSIDALLVASPPDVAEEVMRVVRGAGVEMREIGHVEEGRPEGVLLKGGEETGFEPGFRESAYTPLKRVVEGCERDREAMRAGIDRAAAAAQEKKRRVLERLRGA
ncbi:MAG: AIR synthase-related protein [Methanomicrobiales archaeon]|nr:AIR synthase-related protein [Methanomicrobiales archaeon]